MQVSIKDFSVAMEIKKSGIELDIYSPDGKDHLGDLIVNQAGLTWCRGKTTKKNGTKVSWEKFIKWVQPDQ